MKTRAYKLGTRIVTLAITILISTAAIAGERDHENTSPAKYQESVILTTTEAYMVTRFEMLGQTIHDWMAKGAYWEAEDENPQNTTIPDKDELQITESSNLISNLRSWMANGDYWKSENNLLNEK